MIKSEWAKRRTGETEKKTLRLTTRSKMTIGRGDSGRREETDQAFSGSGCLSKCARSRAPCLRVEQEISRRGAICANRSNSSFVALSLRKHCGGVAQAALHRGFHLQAKRFRRRGRRNASAYRVCISPRLYQQRRIRANR